MDLEPLRAMASLYRGTCSACGHGFRVGAQIAYDTDNRRAYHARCASPPTAQSD